MDALVVASRGASEGVIEGNREYVSRWVRGGHLICWCGCVGSS